MKHFYLFFTALLLWVSASAQQTDQLTVMSYNLLNYRSATSYCPFSQNNPLTKEGYLATIVQHVQPDILVCCEIGGGSATNGDFILSNSLNTGSVNYYDKAAYTNNGFSNLVNMLYFNTQKLALKSQQVLTEDLDNNNLVRVIDFYRLYYKDSLLTNQTDTVYFTVVAAHLKAGSALADVNDRSDAAEAIMDYIETYIKDDNVILCGDLNIYKSQEQAYQYLTQYQNSNIRFYDPVNSPGNWGSNSSFAPLHTQSTRLSQTNGGCFSGGGLDDRLDHILITDEIRDNLDDIKYIPNTYMALGNDGLHYNKAITDGPNNSVPANVLTALYGLSDHLPVIAEFEVKKQTIGIAEKQLSNIHVNFANPVSNQLRVVVSNAYVVQPKLTIYNITGKLMLTANMQQEDQKWNYSGFVGNLPKGIYVIEISTANGWRSAKRMTKI